MKFCEYEECPHYSKATKYQRACYYGEPMCWRGWMDLILEALTIWYRGRNSRKESGSAVNGDDAPDGRADSV